MTPPEPSLVPGVPEALYEPLFAALQHPHADVVPVVEAAAVIGRGGDLALLRSVVGHDAEDVDDVVTELVRARVLERRGTDGWRFRHELLREVASELAPPSLHRDLHARAARALVDAAAAVEPDWRVVASHFEQAQQYDKAVEAYQKASVDARRRGAIAEARAYLTNAVNLLARCAAGPARDRREIAIRLERGVLAIAVQGSTSGEAPADFERCLELASSGNYEDELLITLTAMISYYYGRAELRRAHELLDSLSNRITHGSALELSGDRVLVGSDHLAGGRLRGRSRASTTRAGGPFRCRSAGIGGGVVDRRRPDRGGARLLGTDACGMRRP